jgi:hypothetical protein
MSIFQDKNEALIREPGNRTYNAPEPVAVSAKTLWEYAVLSENVYIDHLQNTSSTAPRQKAARPALPEPTLEAYRRVCTTDTEAPIPLEGWSQWKKVPSAGLKEEAEGVGLFVEVWEKDVTPPEIVVAFRGTEFSLKDWITNLRWFLRFIPLYSDQYTVVGKNLGKEILDELKHKIAATADKYKSAKLVATGHSLGGGLAQHLAYSLPLDKMPDGSLMPRVSRVYAFDPSPVTGWSSVTRKVRASNVKGLHIDRIFEHGEILAYIRLIMRYINPPTKNDPSIREIRYNFVDSINPFSSHSMRLIACALIDASGKASIPGLYERFSNR